MDQRCLGHPLRGTVGCRVQKPDVEFPFSKTPGFFELSRVSIVYHNLVVIKPMSGTSPRTTNRLDDPARVARMRQMFVDLEPGERVVVVHHIKIGFREHASRVEGIVVGKDRRECGIDSGWRRNWDDRYWFDLLFLKKDDGETTAVCMDEYTEILKPVTTSTD